MDNIFSLKRNLLFVLYIFFYPILFIGFWLGDDNLTILHKQLNLILRKKHLSWAILGGNFILSLIGIVIVLLIGGLIFSAVIYWNVIWQVVLFIFKIVKWAVLVISAIIIISLIIEHPGKVLSLIIIGIVILFIFL